MTLFSSLKWAGILVLTALMVSCGNTVQKESSITLDPQASGPFFAGPNSLIVDYTVDYNALFPGEEVRSEQIKEIALTEARVSLKADSLDFSSFSSASIQFVSDNEGMISAAILNPISSDGQTIILQTSQEADLSTFFRGEAFTCVLDLDFKDDDYRDELTTTVDMTFNTTLKQ